MTTPDLSIVIPVYNEEANIPELTQRLAEMLNKLGRSHEVLVVDDGSRDGTLATLLQAKTALPHLRIVKLRRNFGQHAATFAGFEAARGRIVVSMDADLQNDPADIPALISKLEEGYDVVGGARIDRKDSMLRRKLPSLLVNRFINARTGLVQTDSGCFLKAYTREAALEISRRTEPEGFFMATIGFLGFRYAEVPVHHRERLRGESRYNLFIQLNMFMSLFTGYARRPFQVVEIIGGAAVAGALACGAGAAVGLIPNTPIHFLLYLILGLLGLTIGTLGIVGEFAVRIYYGVRATPRYLIDKIIE